MKLTIEQLEQETKLRIEYAKRLTERCTRYYFMPDLKGHCNFAGYLLVTVIDRKSEAAVYIQDVDDWNVELTVSTAKKAERVFDDLFTEEPWFDDEFIVKLRNYGFTV